MRTLPLGSALLLAWLALVAGDTLKPGQIDGVAIWKTVTGGAVRGQPALFQDTVVVPSDDGVLYGLQAGKGCVVAQRLASSAGDRCELILAGVGLERGSFVGAAAYLWPLG
jgi:hypothetical protein